MRHHCKLEEADHKSFETKLSSTVPYSARTTLTAAGVQTTTTAAVTNSTSGASSTPAS
jgi:hypothetical protein